MGSVTKKPSPVVIIKKKRRILSHQDDAVQAVPDDIKPAPVMEFNTSHSGRFPGTTEKNRT